MAYKTYTREMLSGFTGRTLTSFPETFVNGSAIPQAVLLFKIATAIVDPALLDAESQQLVDFAILSMADAIHLSAPYQVALASPFNSESIGSYSYSKTAVAIKKGLETGIMWFDMAVALLSQKDALDGSFMGGGIEIFEHDGMFVTSDYLGNVALLTPADVRLSRQFGYDPNLTVGG